MKEEQEELMREVPKQEVRPLNKNIKYDPPVYWPGERVPLLPITYCQLVQGIFGVLMVGMMGYVIFGLK